MSEKRSTVDLSHHLSDFAKTLVPRPAPGSNVNDGMIGMDGGVPDTEYFPIESITVEYLNPSAFSLTPTDALPHGPGVLGWLANVFTGKGTGSKTTDASTDQFVIPRRLQPNTAGKFELKTALQYSPVTGLAAADKIVHDWVARVHKPAYDDWNTLIDVGSSSAWMTCITILLNPGESFLCDRYAYNTALNQGLMRGMFPVAVASDMDGLSAVDLERVLASWDAKARGFARPRVIYTQGGIQNPSGLLITAQRKKDVYDVAVRYDLIIVEDDPYYFQQASLPYGSGAAPKNQTDDAWLDGLVPSFLRFDYEGRVIRLDTFSKSVGPGGRLGYFTASPVFLEKLASFQQNFISFPSGLSQAIVGGLLDKYQTEGFTRWLRGITAQYELRRNWTLDALHKALDVRSTDGWSRSLTAFSRADGGMSEKFTKSASLMSFVPPDGGMFIWFNIHLHNHPRYKALARQTSPASAKNQLSFELWTAIYDAGVVFRRGELFAVEDDEERARAGEEDVFLRASFSSGTKESLEKGMGIFATTLVGFFA
ncbi:PLP-dependent transferase [Mycena haematopus]|nr:PLP-dependent transferase [Mycena haematopus]